MAKDTIHSDDERHYDIQEAARLLDKTDAALRMQIKRNSIRAVKRPLGETGRFKYVIPESEVEKERRRLESSTRRSEPRRSETETVGQSAASDSRNVASMLRSISQKQEQLEKDLQQEREDTRALIRSMEQQIELMKMMMTTLMERDRK